MGDLGKIHQLIIPMGGHNAIINIEVVVMTWIVIRHPDRLRHLPPAAKAASFPARCRSWANSWSTSSTP